jgi:hypothetical protein
MKPANRSASTARHTIAAATENVLGTHRLQRRLKTRYSKEGVRRGGSSNCSTSDELQDPSAERPNLENAGADAQQNNIAGDAVTIISTVQQIIKILKIAGAR